MQPTTKSKNPKLAVAHKIADHLVNDLEAAIADLEALLRKDCEPRSEGLILGLTFGVIQARNQLRDAIGKARKHKARVDRIDRAVAECWRESA